MSKLEELINKLCPNGVEFKTLGDIAIYRRGSFPQPYTNTSFYGGEDAMPFVQVADIEDDGFKLKDKTKQTISKIAQPKSIFVPKGTVICSIQGTIGRVAITQYDSYVDRTIAIFESLNNKIDKKFFAYCIEVKFEFEKQFARGSTLKTITKEEFTKFSIPVPPLEVQCEIVRILDNFTLLSAELSAELSARQKQYDYYKQKVLDDIKTTNNIKHITDIALVKARVGWQRLTRAEYLYEGNYFLITGTDFVADGSINFDTCVYISKDRYDMDQNIQVHKDDILITKDGTLGKVAILKDEPPKETTLNSGVFRISVLNKQEVYPQYLYHYFTSKYFKDFVESVKTGSTIPHLTQQGLVTLDIPIPELNEQVKISNLLDKFDKLCNDISEGLPAEIEARKKQYEYYRDKLLTFKELK
ncbi:restriction endonuclease subunit S [Campylobacter devanensis]|uniref:restriction endonuclease subunit S n=1 Tax=Campylobacter devanensis TaxID=3161138 RepID=UPI00112F6404|nr:MULTISPECIES: restriction endonuclease subunit S [unclassified Campylobacter]